MKALLTLALLLMHAAVSPAAQAQDMDEPATGQIRGTLLTSAIAAVFVAPPLPAMVAAQTTPQSTDDLCFHARPAPACRFFTVTDFGVLVGTERGVVLGYPYPERSSTGGVIVEWGVMRNLGPRNAIGVSWFFAFNGDGLSTGPTMRYRRWLKGRQSLDFGVGTPIERNPNNVERGSVLGLAKYNPVPWFGVAVRPEVLRRSACFPAGVGLCAGAVRTVSTARVLVGIELSERPGAITSGIWGGLLGLGAVLLGGL